jgi:hypothetical protein
MSGERQRICVCFRTLHTSIQVEVSDNRFVISNPDASLQGKVVSSAPAMAVRRGVPVGDLPVGKLQEQLRADGVQLETELTGEAARRVAASGM